MNFFCIPQKAHVVNRFYPSLQTCNPNRMTHSCLSYEWVSLIFFHGILLMSMSSCLKSKTVPAITFVFIYFVIRDLFCIHSKFYYYYYYYYYYFIISNLLNRSLTPSLHFKFLSLLPKIHQASLALIDDFLATIFK